MTYEDTIRRPDPRRPESWYREGVAHDHRACGTLWDSTDEREIAEAARWADEQRADRYTAAGLPDGSVVATAKKAFLKAQHFDIDDQPIWLVTGEPYEHWYMNRRIQELLDSGEAAVLRVGTGGPS